MTTDYNQGDVDFVQMMIPHHQVAVTAAAREYLAAKSPEVKEWARKIMLGQQGEIEQFRAWLQQRGIAEKAPKGM